MLSYNVEKSFNAVQKSTIKDLAEELDISSSLEWSHCLIHELIFEALRRKKKVVHTFIPDILEENTTYLTLVGFVENDLVLTGAVRFLDRIEERYIVFDPFELNPCEELNCGMENLWKNWSYVHMKNFTREELINYFHDCCRSHFNVSPKKIKLTDLHYDACETYDHCCDKYNDFLKICSDVRNDENEYYYFYETVTGIRPNLSRMWNLLDFVFE